MLSCCGLLLATLGDHTCCNKSQTPEFQWVSTATVLCLPHCGPLGARQPPVMQLHHAKPMASQGLCGTEKTGDRAAEFVTVLRAEDLRWSQLNYSTSEPLPGRLGAVVFPEGHGVAGMQMASSRLGCVQVLSPVHPSLLPWSRGFPGPFI